MRATSARHTSIEDHQRCDKILAQYSGATLFVNIDRALKQLTWKRFIRYMISHPPGEDAKIGVLWGQSVQDLDREHLIDIGTQCRFGALNLEVEQSAKTPLKTLEAAEAKGKRKHVRGPDGDTAILTVQNSSTAASHVIDIHAAGMRFQFTSEASFKVGHQFDDVLSILHGVRTSTRAHVITVRHDQPKSEDTPQIYVMIFDHPTHGQRSVASYTELRLSLATGANRRGTGPTPPCLPRLLAKWRERRAPEIQRGDDI